MYKPLQSLQLDRERQYEMNDNVTIVMGYGCPNHNFDLLPGILYATCNFGPLVCQPFPQHNVWYRKLTDVFTFLTIDGAPTHDSLAC